MSAKASKGVYIAAFVLLLGGLGYLIASGLSQGATPTLSVAQAKESDAADLQRVRLFGKVLPQDIALRDDNLGVAFIVADEVDPAVSMRVEYRGAVPDTFKEGVEVILKGDWDQGAGVFRASQLVTKCPSKYEEKRADS
ncbi:cytochrome c maturation protein CcmE [Paucidesulfovibrio longus]|uniref:cytochrome c maturation protein CcmE n=1 Tax=Paucidesulfovibrio longus TaxID=889 RepID=UPI0003B3BA29|nr:cytochrome c maturation protein CcmE [Paucidesulfovibrio longus]